MLPTAQYRVLRAPHPRRLRAKGWSAAALVLAGIALWQQIEIYALEHAHGRPTPATAGVVNLHRLPVTHFTLPSRLHPAPANGSSHRPDIDGAPDFIGSGWTLRNAGRANEKSVLANADFVNAYELYREGMLDARYADLFRRLDLTPAELAAFKHLLAEKDSLALDVVAVSQAAVDPSRRAAVEPAEVQTAQSEIEDSIRSTLGSDRYDTYRDYESTMAQRATVAQLERRLSYTSAPLSSGQADELVKVLAVHAPADAASTVPSISFVVGADPSGVVPVVNPDASGLITDEALAEARGVLTAPQLAALHELQIEQQAVLEAGRLIMDGSATPSNQPPTWGLLLQ